VSEAVLLGQEHGQVNGEQHHDHQQQHERHRGLPPRRRLVHAVCTARGGPESDGREWEG
jgi:hypothetical protein